MNTDPQTTINADGLHSTGLSDAQARHAGTEAPRFPSGALRDWLNHRLKLSVPVWAVIVASLVLLGVILD